MEQEVLNLANQQVQLAISNALNCFTQISSSIFPNQSFRPHILLRCRSSSSNRNNRRGPFHHPIPRYSIPTTKNDLVHYQSRLLTCQTHGQTSPNLNSNAMNRPFDVQYSFSLNQPWLTELNKQQQDLISIQNFVDLFLEQSIQTTLLGIDDRNLTNDRPLSDENETSCLVLDCISSSVPMRRLTSYAVRFVHSTIEQAIEDVSSFRVKLFSNRLAEEIMTDALSIIADDETYFLKMRKKSTHFENTEQQERNFFHQIPYHSSSIIRLITNNSRSNDGPVDVLVNNIAQQIYTNSFDELRQIFTKTTANGL